MKNGKYTGLFTALVTPMISGDICYESLEKLIHHQLKAKVDGLLLLGTTGEAPTISDAEKAEIIKTAKDFIHEKAPLMVGATSNNTTHAIELAKLAEKSGADAILTASPYYNKPSQQGLFRHFSMITEAVKIPIMLYSHPGRCGVEISIEVIKRLRNKHENIIGIKEVGSSCDRVSEISAELGQDFLILSGEDSLTLPFLSVGAKGIISSVSNLAPKDTKKMVNLALKNDFKSALEIHNKLLPLFKYLFIESNPVPLKYALWKKELISSPETRPPLCPMSEEHQAIVKKALAESEQ